MLLISGSDACPVAKRSELTGSLRGKRGLRRFLRRTKTGLRIDDTAIGRSLTCPPLATNIGSHRRMNDASYAWPATAAIGTLRQNEQ